MLFVGGAAWWSAVRSAETFRWVDHTHEVLYRLEATLTKLLVLQSNSRGYALTAREDQLRTYAADETAAREDMRRLRQLVADNPAQSQRLDRLDPLFAHVIDLFSARIALRRSGGLEAVLQPRANTAPATMDLILAGFNEMEAAERSLLAERSAAAQADQSQAVLVFGFGTLAATALVGVAGFLVRRDFYQRVKAEAERDRFFSLSLDLLCIASTDGYFKRVSSAVPDMLGWSVEEFLRTPYIELVHPDDRESTLQEVQRQIRTGAKVLQFENRYRHKDGSWRVLSWRSVPVDGLMYAIARDVTKEKAAEIALRTSELEFRTLFESIDEGYCIFEVLFDAGGRAVDYRFLRTNPAFEKQSGLTGARGKRMREYAPDHEEIWFETFGRIVRTGEAARFQDYSAHTGRWFDVYAFRYGDPANRQVATIFTNITERKKSDEQIRRLNADLHQRANQLEAANKELEAFSYSVSHDLRAPLRHVDGFANLLQKNSAAALDAQGRRYLATISDSARQMGRLIDDLLSFSRMGRAALQLREVDDHDALVATVIRDGRWDRVDRPIDWHLAPLPCVHADRVMLQQVWANLLDNAVKYSGKVPAPRIEIGTRTDPATGERVFFVRDNGAGFDMRYVDKLFGVFQRLHGPAEFEGTGIGLANVRRIILRHGGRTWAEGAPGQGATFYFSLPATLTPVAA